MITKPLYEATLRHVLANSGFEDAARLACTLLEITHGEALQLVGWLSCTTSHHIHKPREWNNA